MPQLKFFAGPMGAGKSTLALQLDHNYRSVGRAGVVLSCFDRGGSGVVTSRLGLSRTAIDVTDGLDLFALVSESVPAGGYVIADEVQFYSPEQIDQLARCVDEAGVEVACFGRLTDFQSCMFPGSKRLLELADSFQRLQLEVLCWCGQRGQQNARVVDGRVVHEGAQVVVGDTGGHAAVRYVVLCRAHWRSRMLASDDLSATTA